MNLLEAVRSSLEALRANLLRSLLTMLGIFIGVAAVIAMVAVGSGARELVLQQIKSLGSNLMIIVSGSVTSGGVRMGSGSRLTLSEDDAVALQREIPSIQVSAGIMRGTAQLVAGNLNWSTVVQGVHPGYFEAREWEIDQGRGFNPEEFDSAGQTLLIGYTVAYNLFGESDPVGQQVRVKNVPFTVIGVLQRKGQNTFGQDQDDTVIVPLTTAKRRVLGTSQANARAVGTILVKVRDGDDMAEAEQQIRNLLRQRHRLQPHQDDDFWMRNLSEVAETRDASSRTLALLLAAVAAVSLIVGGIGIMNIMLVSVTERTREIGLRLAVGARRRDILAQFLIEAVSLSMIGGVAGVALGAGAAVAIARVGGWPILIQPEAVALAVGFSALVGIFFGFYPARRAAQLDPIEALRHE
ncbi:MAG: FtsX-like permease family protein [Alphaproteobacteria bacterium]|nr:FtsX-like permease family protein [Alphaproteobacteria bacterium]